jgi:hypothetical protein
MITLIQQLKQFMGFAVLDMAKDIFTVTVEEIQK